MSLLMRHGCSQPTAPPPVSPALTGGEAKKSALYWTTAWRRLLFLSEAAFKRCVSSHQRAMGFSSSAATV
ncbi:MAG: hypothetical protein ACAF41_33360 (plasmid) [Leptolyngbya sp. BL-A-14]